MNRLRIRVFVLSLMIAAIPFAVLAEPIARNTGGGTTMDWQVNATDYEEVHLRWVAPDGEVGFAGFRNGERVSLSLKDLGTELQEGQYQWDLWVVPKIPTDVAAKLAAARAANDDRTAKQIMKDAGLLVDRSAFGGFVIANGQFVNTEGKEEGASARRSVTTNAAARPSAPIAVNDQVIPDDLIVQGSLCVGFDCVNNEDFGFDTIRMKENNTRLQFNDTSSTAGYPTNNWQIRANDSASGGSSFLGFMDQGANGTTETGTRVFAVTAGAAANSLFVASTGRIGFRTSTPVLDLHVNTSNTPAIRLEQNNTGGFTAQTWDIGANEANFFVRDVTGGSKLPFRIRPGAPTSSVDISADGDVGIGTASPDEKLHVLENADTATFLTVENPNTGTNAVAVLRADSDVAQVNFQAHSSTRMLSRFGQTLGGWNEMLAVTGDGLIIGTNTAADLILGTNAAARLTINGNTGAITVPGNFTVSGVKNFAVVDPGDSKKALYYTALEGPEAGTYFRGTAKTVNGEVVIELPGYFARLTESERMTVHLTPLGAPGLLYVASQSPEKLVIKVAEGTADLEFAYLVHGIRKGYLDYEVERTGAFPVQQ